LLPGPGRVRPRARPARPAEPSRRESRSDHPGARRTTTRSKTPRIHESVGFFVEHLPPLGAGHRGGPGGSRRLPLARLRTQGLLHEVGVDALRFDRSKPRSCFEQETGLALEPAVVAALEAKNEGWPRGASTWPRSHSGAAAIPSRFVDEFTGDHRLLADYLCRRCSMGSSPRYGRSCSTSPCSTGSPLHCAMPSVKRNGLRVRSSTRWSAASCSSSRSTTAVEWYPVPPSLRRAAPCGEHVAHRSRPGSIALHARAAAWLRDAGFRSTRRWSTSSPPVTKRVPGRILAQGVHILPRRRAS